MSQEWLKELERTVHEATETIGELRRERRDLADRVEELEGELEAARDQGGAETVGATSEEASAWHDERQEIRRRVESLTEKLEGLLEEEVRS